MIKRATLQTLVLLGAARLSYENPASSDTALTIRSDVYPENTIRLQNEARGMEHHDEPMEEPKSKPWLGYYDFLITEGSYKFWVVFELFTVALLIYSAFAALYYAKYTVTDYEYDDYFFRKRSARSIAQQNSTFLGLSPETYVRIFEAIADINKRFTRPKK